MSDDLVKCLRDLGDHASFEPHMHHTAADRIEELEAKLAMVVAVALEECPCRWETPNYDNWRRDRLVTLAELAGGKDE